MTSSPVEVLRQLLIDNDLAFMPPLDVSTDWQCFTDKRPTQPDNIIYIRSSMGKFDGRIMRPPFTVNEHPGFQLQVRATDPTIARNRANDISEFFNSVNNVQVIINAVTWNIQNISRVSSILPMQEETENQRDLYFFNGRVTLWAITTP
jgi:hypothetical protein